MLILLLGALLRFEVDIVPDVSKRHVASILKIIYSILKSGAGHTSYTPATLPPCSVQRMGTRMSIGKFVSARN
jgi:hypothetical protein